MKLMTWNIQQGGSAKRDAGILAAIHDEAPDVLVLTEFRERSAVRLRDGLHETGLKYDICPEVIGSRNGVYVAARQPFGLTAGRCRDFKSERWVCLRLHNGLTVLGVHIPGKGDKGFNKRMFWEQILQVCTSGGDGPDVVFGDFNTGLTEDAEGEPFECAEFMRKLGGSGWQDAWRKIHGQRREYTWFHTQKGRTNGFRLDYCFLRANLADRILEARHLHHVRETRLSDHSALLVELEIE